MSYHSSKGLDFDNVFLPYLNNSFYLHPSNANTLFMVAMTRSQKKSLLNILSVILMIWLTSFKGECTEISISDILNQRTSTRSNNNFDF
jgi:superfamily I DNA/RNA helicase